MAIKSPIDRLLEYLNYKGIKPATAEKMAGLSNGFIKNAGNRSGEIGSDALRKIGNAFLDIRLTWLITEEGDMLKTGNFEGDTPDANNTVDISKPVILEDTPNAKRKNTTLKTTANTTGNPNFSTNLTLLSPQIISVDSYTEKENILHVNAKAAAGYLTGYADREYMGNLPAFNLPGLTDATYRSFEVDGDSMHPTLKSGQMVIGKWVEKLDYIRDDRVYIVVHKTRGIVIKRLLNRIERDNVIYAKSDATNDRELYKTFPIRPDEIQELWYAVFHGGFDFQSPSDMWKRLNNNEADLVGLEQTVKQLTSVLKDAGLLK